MTELTLSMLPNPTGFGNMLKQVGLKERFEVIAAPADGLADLASRCASLIVDEAGRAPIGPASSKPHSS